MRVTSWPNLSRLRVGRWSRLVRHAGEQRRRRARIQQGRNFYGQWIKHGDVCFDVGANVGDRTRIFLALGATVVAVEPQPFCIAALRRIQDDRLRIETVALGSVPDTAILRIADSSTLSSLEEGWIERVRESGRFADYKWEGQLEVQVSTLDALISRYGIPSFCKIDVEGYEAQVLKGLSRPLPYLSFEFTPEWTEAAEDALERLEWLGFSGFNFSVGESLELLWHGWRSAREVRDFLLSAPRDAAFFGDVYARAAPNPSATN